MKTVHRITFLIGLAFAPLVQVLRGREVAINATAEASSPQEAALGIPTGLSATAVSARRAALIAAGTPAMYATQFAIDAEQQQAWHDNPKSRQGDQATAKTGAEQIAAGILQAHKADPNRAPKTLTSKQLKERAEIVERVEAASEQLAGAKNDDARATAQQALADAQEALARLDAQS